MRGGCSRMRRYTRNMGLSHQKSCAMLKVWLDLVRAQGNPLRLADAACCRQPCCWLFALLDTPLH
jgi:hypothetical protein